MEQEGVTASSAPELLESASKNKIADFADRTSDTNFSPSGMANDEKEYPTSGTKRESLTASPKDKFSLKSDSSNNLQKSNPSYHSIKAELPLKTTANLPEYMGRASIIPVRSFTSNDSKISVYSKDDYNSLDKTMSMLRQEQEAEMYNWESIINEKLDRDSWTGGFGISPKKKLIQPFQHLTELNGKSSDINIAANHSSLEPYNAFFDEPTTKLTRSSLYSEFSDTISLPETYISESELAEKPELCKTFQERQNERTKRLAVKMLNVIDSLAPTKYVLPTYQTTKYTIPVSMHTFKLNRVRLHERMKSEDPRGFILLKGGEIVNQYNTDSTYTFRQEPFFHWTFGVRHPSFWGGICLKTGSSFLFIPRSSERDETWKRKTPSPNDYKQMYGVSKVMYENEMDSVLTKYNPRKLFLLCGMNSDSGLVLNQPILPVDTTIEIDLKTLYPIMCELRVIKNDYEIELIRQACIVSSDAHKYVMHSMVGMVGYYEYQAQSLFIHYCSYMGGCRTTAYNCICGTDPNAAILHYGQTSMDNNKILKSGDLCIFDMGVSYYGYASDITCTYPVNGKFTDDQKIIYNAVLKGRERALEVIRPGIGWDQVHLEVLAAIFTEMRQEALLFGDVDEMIEAELGAVFMPHGIGHLLGIDVHDVGGYNLNTPPKPTRRSLIKLRTCRRLTKNMVLTIEPGCYFIEKLLEEADENKKLAKFINFQRISQYGHFRGIRIEDVVLVTEFGCEVLSDVPRSVDEIEAWMNSQPMEGGFDQYIGDNHLPCLCAKEPPPISQLRIPTGDIIKRICGCKDEIRSSSSAETLHYDKNICSSRDSVSEVIDGDKFSSKDHVIEKECDEVKPESEQSEIDLEEYYGGEEIDQAYWKSKIPFVVSDTNSSASSKHKYSTTNRQNKGFGNKEKAEEGNSFQHPKAPPPTKPIPSTLSQPQDPNQKGINPFTVPHVISSNPHARDEDLLIVTEKESKNSKLK